MKRCRHASLALFTVLLVSCAGSARLQVSPGQHPGSFTTTVRTTMTLPYLLYQPEGFGSTEQRWPLLVFLHGSGERGPDLDKVKVHGPPRRIAEGHEFGFVVLSPQCPERDYWTNEAPIAALEQLIEQIASDPRIDDERIYVTGMSMGGFATWKLAARNPHRFAAIVPVCGGGDPESAASFAHLPVWAFHGAKDDVVPWMRSQEMIDALHAAGAQPRFTVYPESGHDSWTETYANPDLYSWLLAQRRAD